ncbi:hypothetical protein C8R47DRAFT_1079688 [Mycena vitilis]|nr:hypothetical protein C8R47DRAFT_1079688 [Mycena vitilis]
MHFSPPWSTHTLPPRGKAIPLDLELVDLIGKELKNSDRRSIVEAPFRTAAYALRYLPSPLPTAEWSEGFISHFSPYPLHRRVPSSLAELTVIPDVLDVGHLKMLGFTLIEWDDPRAFVDLEDRIDAFFIGPPRERTQWERTIIDATHAMERARRDFDRRGIDDHTLHTGFKNGAKGVQRPQNFLNHDRNTVILAELRHSVPIQEIISFQNAAMQTVAPEIWGCANTAIETVMDNDASLRLPFHQCLGQPDQPTAFAEVEYIFHIADSRPKPRLRDRATGWTAFTSLGNYDAGEGTVILWQERRIVRFPVGSTFLVPAGLFSYSFAGISEYSSRMLISQSFDGDIWRFIEGGMSSEPKAPSWPTYDDWKADRRARAQNTIKLFPTLHAFDQAHGFV